ncbi:uncharacterized protein [Diadema antillarum]|uniref:uncharacterized protein n=1 Tax=Diadema antillarum TaxID=105358 RepID=UPI003A83FFA2
MVVDTVSRVQGWKGEDIRLSCHFQGQPAAVVWIKETISYQQLPKAEFIDGKFESLEQGFDIDKNFSLVITDLEVANEGLYLCQVLLKNFDNFENSVFLTVSYEFRYQIQWLLFNVAAVPSIISTGFDWGALYYVVYDKIPTLIFISLNFLPTVVCFVDIFITLIVIRFLHVVYPGTLLIFYVLFAVGYWAAGGTDPSGNPFISPILDFGNYPGIAAATVMGVSLLTWLLQAGLKGLYAVRVRCMDSRRQEPVPSTDEPSSGNVELEKLTE